MMAQRSPLLPPRTPKDARQAAITRFGHKPTATQVLQAHLISSPGTQYREWIHPDVILEAAKMALTEIPPAPPSVKVERVETVSFENVWEGEPGEPIWRIVLNDFCADFPTETAARNFANQISGVTEH